ncbi:uncharacterized protein VP01_1026g2 [Puccinia sorghi]|uniref:Integrase zinc-binding domain-containing protein n=1 Tax=Puccinia sorghi TaxID=27349 RepID=A0A0L6VUN6_9BASI|nr:uncharacterized protein VP01_1026g2 [Puccinia sorghi]
MNIMACSNGNDGYPSQAEFNRRMEHYIVRKKRSERTVVSEGELAIIYNLLTDPSALRAEADVSHRTWVKKTFMLKTFAHGTFVCHKDKGQSISQPVASKEKMYFILKQAHASEGHGGRDKTAKAVKKTHSFIRKGLICLFLEVCPTCRARNDAVKKDKLTNAQSQCDAPSPLGHLQNSSIYSVDSWDQSSYALRSANPYQSSSTTLESTSPLYPPAEDYHRLTIPSLSTALRRAPSHGVAGTLFPDPGTGHVRSHTFPLLDNSYPPAQPEASAYPSLEYGASPSPLLSATDSQHGSTYYNETSYNPDHLSELTFALQQQSFCAPIFAVQVDAPGYQQQPASAAAGYDYFQNDQTYFLHNDHSSASSSPSEPQNSNPYPSSTNLFDPVNASYLLSSSQSELPINYPSSSSSDAAVVSSTQFDTFPHEQQYSVVEENSPGHTTLAHEPEGIEMNSQVMMSSRDGSYTGTPQEVDSSSSYEERTSYEVPSVEEQTGSKPLMETHSEGPVARRTFAEKNHKNLSLQSLDTSGQSFTMSNSQQGGFRSHDDGCLSGPSTAGSFWTTADTTHNHNHINSPLSSHHFHQLLHPSDSRNDDPFNHDQLPYLQY